MDWQRLCPLLGGTTSTGSDPQLHLAPVLTDGPPTRDTSTFDGFFECGAEIEAHDLLLSGTIAKRVGMKVVP